MADILSSYGDVSVKPDVLGMIEILTATESSVFNKLGKTKAIQTIHETLTDTLDSVTSLAASEQGDFVNTALSTPVRVTNIIQIIAKKFEVSRTQQEIEHFQGENEIARQTSKALKDWHNAAEYDLVRGSLVSGLSGTAPKMGGIINSISRANNTTVQTSGTVFSASILRGLMKDQWDNSNGDVATDVYVGSYLKDQMDSFANKATLVTTGVAPTAVMNVVDVFETGLGKVAVHPHRYVQIAADATARILGINPEKLKVAMLRAPYIREDLPSAGDYDGRAIVGKQTLEVRNRQSNFFASGYLKA